MARVLVGCECSGRVREAFRRRGHDAWSCDMEPAEDGSPYHIRGNVLDVLGDGWDLGIFHPPCTYLTNAGARWLFIGGRKINGRDESRWAGLDAGANLFNRCLTAPIQRIAVENPWPHTWAVQLIGRPDQKAQPWWFGDKQKKGLCLWLQNLPLLVKDNDVGPPPPRGTEEAKAWEFVWRCSTKNRARDRSRTFPGFARAMADQWGPLLSGDTPCSAS